MDDYIGRFVFNSHCKNCPAQAKLKHLRAHWMFTVHSTDSARAHSLFAEGTNQTSDTIRSASAACLSVHLLQGRRQIMFDKSVQIFPQIEIRFHGCGGVRQPHVVKRMQIQRLHPAPVPIKSVDFRNVVDRQLRSC